MVRATFDVPHALRRIVARHATAWLACAVAGALWTVPAIAEDTGGPIVIPGPGQQNSADLAKMTAMATSTSRAGARPANQMNAANTPALASVAPATPVATDRFSTLANASGAIVIPGTGEPPAAAAPHWISTAQNNPPAAAGMIRVNMNSTLAASQVVPVIVTSTPPRQLNAAAVRPIDAVPAGDFEIASLASRGEPPELGASAVNRNPMSRAATTPTRAPNQALARLAAPAPAQLQPQALAEAAQRAQAIQAMQQGLGARGAGMPMTQAAQAVPTAQASRAVQAAQPVQPVQPVPTGQEDGEAIHAAALDFLKQQVNGLPGHVELTVAPAFPRGLAACATLQPFLPNGARLWGRTTVGVRCTSGHPWTVWLQAKVSVNATYYVAARAMAPGEVVTDADLIGRDGDLTMLPMSIVTAPSQAVGSVTLMRVGAGLPLRQDMLKNAQQVTAGQTVQVVAQGNGFQISSEGSALSNAQPGQPVRVKTAAGQIVMGIVKNSSTVQIQM